VDPPSGLTDLVPENNEDSVTSDFVALPSADLSISKTADLAFFVPGETTAVSYTIVVANHGPDDVTAATLSEPSVAHLNIVDWTCTADAVAQCAAASGLGSPDGEQFDLPAHSAVTFVVNANIDSLATDTITNTASVESALLDPDLSNNAAFATVAPGLAPNTVNLALAKTVAPVHYDVGQTTSVTYTLFVENIGTTPVSNAQVKDIAPAGVTFISWSCEATLGTCSASGYPDNSGALNDLVSLSPKGSAVYTVLASVDSSVTGTLANHATVTPPDGITDVDLSDNQSTATLSPQGNPTADLEVVQSVSPGSYTPTDTTAVVYTIVATNHGPANVVDATINGIADTGLVVDNWTCAPGSGATCPASGNGPLQDIKVGLNSGSTLTIMVYAHIDAAQLGDKSFEVNIAPPDGITDPLGNNDSAISWVVQNKVPVDLSVIASANIDSYVIGQSSPIEYSLTVANSGPGTANGAVLSDILSNGLTVLAWQCQVLTGTASCPAPDGGVGELDQVLLTLGSDSSVLITIQAILDGSAPNITYTAKITEPPGANNVDYSNNTASVTVLGELVPPNTPVQPVPLLSIQKLILLALLLAIVIVPAIRKRN
jgi:uncharacterized repeat protein (TIGR01451 family)